MLVIRDLDRSGTELARALGLGREGGEGWASAISSIGLAWFGPFRALSGKMDVAGLLFMGGSSNVDGSHAPRPWLTGSKSCSTSVATESSPGGKYVDRISLI